MIHKNKDGRLQPTTYKRGAKYSRGTFKLKDNINAMANKEKKTNIKITEHKTKHKKTKE